MVQNVFVRCGAGRKDSANPSLVMGSQVVGSDQVNLFLLLDKLWIIAYILLLEYPYCSLTTRLRKMPRANRHYIPGQVRHITHRCHIGYPGPTPKPGIDVDDTTS